ncbi:sigma-70 family RNA polymerase sigma factor [Streptomyces chartreusis]|uniref:RNA polymerase sigma factor n=1 Tax=Streptomyces chartreusis TaxID=1969 RepID=UPI002E198749
MTAPIPASWCNELEACYGRSVKRVYRRVFSLTRGDRQLTEDVVQEAFHEAAKEWRALRLRDEDGQVAWLCQTATYIAYRHFRSNETARRKQPDVHQHYQGPVADTPHEAFTGAALDQCWKVIASMPPPQHIVAVLRWRCGYKNREIAKMLGIAEKTVSAHVSAARGTLRREAGAYLPFGTDDEERDTGHA